MNFDLDTSNDEDFFGSLERKPTNLDHLFGVDAYRNNGNQTLKYQPTKQPGQASTSAAAASATAAWNTRLAKVTNAFKQGEAVGKVGVALLTNDTGDLEAKIILYKTKKNVLSTLTLQLKGQNTEQIHQQSRYLQFYDDDCFYWSLLFDNLEEELAFVDELQKLGVSVKEQSKKPDKSEDSLDEGAPKPADPIIGTTESPDAAAMLVANTTTHSKHSLITRIAKMGQQLPMLPALAQSNTEYTTDSSDTEVIATPLPSSQKPLVVPRANKLQTKTQIVAANNMSLYNPATAASNAVESQFMQMLLTEHRTQNTEMRMNMNKLESKIEKVLDKIDLVGSAGSHGANKEDEMLALEEKLLEMKKENRRLKQTLESRAQKSEEQNLQNITKIHKNNFQKLNISAPSTDLETLIADLIEKAIKLQTNFTKSESDLEEQSKALKANEQKLLEQSKELMQVLEKQQDLAQAIKTLESTVDEQSKKEQQLQQKLEEQARQHAAQNEEQKQQAEAMMKAIMNNLYESLASRIENLDGLQKNAIIALVGKTIREETLKAMESVKKP